MNWKILAVALVFGATAAQAGDIRYPESGDPAVTAQIPDDWTAKAGSDGNLSILSVDRKLQILFSIVPYDGTLDDAAGEAMKANHAAEPGRGDAVTISGHDGYAYYSMMAGDNGEIVNVKMIAVRLDALDIGLFTLLTGQKINALQIAAGQAVLDSIKLAPPQ